jgi:hypothetical protein
MASGQKHSLRLERENWRLESKTTAKILLVLVGFGVLSWLSLTQTSKVSSARYRILNKQAQQACLQRENAELLGGIMEMVEVSDLEKRALGSGYVPADSVRYLTVPGYSPARTELRRSDGVSRGEMGVAVRLEEKAPVPQEEVGQDAILPYSVSWLWNKVISQFEDWVRE